MFINFIHKKENNNGILFVICAPSGTGKTTILEEALKRLRHLDIAKVITYTTRNSRSNEIHERDYFFVSFEKFQEMKKAGEFLETTEYNGFYYGSPASIKQALQKGHSLVVTADLPGAKRIHKLIKSTVLILLVPPNLEVLRTRLKKRGTETEIQINRRINIAQQELEQTKKTGIFHHRVVNDDFEQTIETVCNIIKDSLVKSAC